MSAKWVCPKCGSPHISYDDESHMYTCVFEGYEFPSPMRREDSPPETRAHDPYLSTISRLEPKISPIDASAFYASAAISLKRLADSSEKIAQALQPGRLSGVDHSTISDLVWEILSRLPT